MALNDTIAGQQLSYLHGFVQSYAQAGYEYATAVLDTLTVGQVSQLLDQALAVLKSTNWTALYNQLEQSGAFNNPALAPAKAILESLKNGDLSIFDTAFNTVREALAGYDPSASVIDAFSIDIPPFQDIIAKFDFAELSSHLSVVASTYQFFTDKVPFDSGIVSLIDPAVNENALGSDYYKSFNIENQFINFASNLAVSGEGQSFFDSQYSGLSLREAVEKAYSVIVGNANAPDGNLAGALDFFMNAEAYFQQVAQERGVVRDGVDLAEATNIVMIGSMLNEATKWGGGIYGEAIELLVADVADDGQTSYFGQDLFGLGA